MKVLIASLAAAGLAGCAVYGGDPYGSAGVYYSDNPYYGNAPYAVQGQVHGERGQRRGWRDRDHDGVPNRYDRDRDGDGVPNRRDAYPGDPNRR